MDEKQIGVLAAKRKWTKEEAQEVMEFVDRSGETVAEFSRRFGISVQRIFWWRSQLWEANWKELKKSIEQEQPETRPSFIPVKIQPASEMLQKGEIVVHVTGKEASIEISNADSHSALWIATVIRALSEEN